MPPETRLLLRMSRLVLLMSRLGCNRNLLELAAELMLWADIRGDEGQGKPLCCSSATPARASHAM
jgi:hypothetical protein